MDLSEIEELPKRLLREEAGCAFRLQASVSFLLCKLMITVSSYTFADSVFIFQASIDILLCMKRAISAPKCAKKAYDDGRAKVAEAGKALQDHAHLLKDKQAAKRLVKASEAKLAEMRAALEAALTAAKDAEAAKEAV